ncbi:MAG TPA: nuclear transport factor 2 family protein [Solirubrobacteraceae bacterium]|nr:nuclear transport factor 2 family protein [Solirubrobacteraceae bacterium]
MPWLPELFSVPALDQLEERLQRKLETVPYYEGIVAGELDALVESFAGEPVVHHPVRGRISGVRPFLAYADEMKAWLTQRHIAIEAIDHVIGRRSGFEEVVLHLDAATGRVDVPVAISGNREPDGRLDEIRLYFSSWPFTGRHLNRPPLLQPDSDLRQADVVAEYLRALSAADVEAIVAAFEPDGYAREPAGAQYVHSGRDGVRAFYAYLFSNGGGIPLELCAIVDDGRACALEYNLVRWGVSDLPPQAGIVVYVRGRSGKLAAARIYDDVDPPLGPRVVGPL